MNFISQIEKINTLHLLIKAEHTGSSKALADRMHLAQRTIQVYLDELRQMGAKISYDSIRCTYYYQNGFDIKYHFEIVVDNCSVEK